MKKIRFGFIGLGRRGVVLLNNFFLQRDDIEITALCDVYEDRMDDIEKILLESNRPKPFKSKDYREILKRDDVDAVIISTGWEAHIIIAVAAMEAHKVVGLEVGGAYTIKECWDLVEAYERTQTPFMFLENCCYNKDELLATAMARHGLFGEIVHASGSYTHDIRDQVSKGDEWRHYRMRNYLNRNAENYPTHELGPIAKVLDINRGNRMVSLVSVASKARGMERYIEDHKDTVNPKLLGKKFKQGDIVNTIITCANGETISLVLNTTLPSFAERNFTLRGTKGMYQQTGNLVVIDDKDNMGEEIHGTKGLNVLLNNAKQYEDEFLPDYWKNITPEEMAAGHGGMDVFMLREFVDAIKNKTEMPIDVYDAASWMAITVLSEVSISQSGMPVNIPDFTKGQWLLRPQKDVINLHK